MSLTAKVSKVSVTSNQKDLYILTGKLELIDDMGSGFTKNYSCEFRTGQDNDSTTLDFATKMIEQMNEDIQNYKDCQDIFNSDLLDKAIAVIQEGVNQ